jgi:hypothetical protein
MEHERGWLTRQVDYFFGASCWGDLRESEKTTRKRDCSVAMNDGITASEFVADVGNGGVLYV